MNSLYDKYYLNEKNILEIIQEGIIVFDTSALLDIYFYSEESQEQIFNTALCGLKGRLWIPAQCYFEFLKNKDKVIEKPSKLYESLLESSSKDKGYVPRIMSASKELGREELAEIKGLLKTLKETTSKTDKHPYLNQEVFSSLEQTIVELEEHIKIFSEKTSRFEEEIAKDINKKIGELKVETDDIQQFIECNFEIGDELSFETMLEICEEGRKRYMEKIPPGYEDEKNKKGMQKYGDLFVWKEILYMAMDKKKDVFLITNDVKEDWWDKEQNAPCFELLKEFHSATGKNFWSSSMRDFLYCINKIQGQSNQIPQRIIEEVDDVTKQMFEESLKIEIDNLYSGILKRWIDNESEYILGNRIDISSEWRVFGDCHLYEAINYRGDECLVMMNIVNKRNYANILYALMNLLEIKKYFVKLGKEYKYHQVVVAKSREDAEQIKNQIRTHKKLSHIFYGDDIENDLVYVNDGNLVYVDSNHPMG